MSSKIPLLLSILVLTSCHEEQPLESDDTAPTHLIEMHLGADYLDSIKSVDSISFIKVKPEMPRDFTLEDLSVEMEREDVAALKSILLDEGSYLFDLQKRCVFLPEYALELKMEEQTLLLLYSPGCKEFKIPYGQFNAQIIEIDPSFDRIEELTNKYKAQLEVDNEN